MCHSLGGTIKSQGERPVFLFPWRIMAFPPIRDTREMAFPYDFHMLCPRFSLSEAKSAVAEFGLPEIVQATFYAMLLNEAVELGATHEYTGDKMKSSLIGLRWSTLKVWMHCMDSVLKAAQQYCPTDEVQVPNSGGGQEGRSKSDGPPAPSSDEE